MEALAGIKHIDYVVPSDFPTAEKNLNILKPSVYVKGLIMQINLISLKI